MQKLARSPSSSIVCIVEIMCTLGHKILVYSLKVDTWSTLKPSSRQRGDKLWGLVKVVSSLLLQVIITGSRRTKIQTQGELSSLLRFGYGSWSINPGKKLTPMLGFHLLELEFLKMYVFLQAFASICWYILGYLRKAAHTDLFCTI